MKSRTSAIAYVLGGLIMAAVMIAGCDGGGSGHSGTPGGGGGGTPGDGGGGQPPAGGIPQALVHTWEWARPDPTGEFNPVTGEPLGEFRTLTLIIRADGTAALFQSDRNNVQCCGVGGVPCTEQVLNEWDTSTATVQGTTLTFNTGGGTSTEMNNCIPARNRTGPIATATLTLPWQLTTNPDNGKQALQLPARPFNETCQPTPCPVLLLDLQQ